MGKYSKKGTYGGYDRTNKDREEFDYYATPVEEVVNILETLGYDFTGKVILDNSCGGGHIIEGILLYCDSHGYVPKTIYGTDLINRGYKPNREYVKIAYNINTLDPDYLDLLPEPIDYCIINPPYSLLDQFVQKAFVAREGIILLARTKAIETKKRYDAFLKDKPFTYMYQYVDRISCLTNGTEYAAGVEVYAWFVWDANVNQEPVVRWIWSKKTKEKE